MANRKEPRAPSKQEEAVYNRQQKVEGLGIWGGGVLAGKAR